MMTAGVALAPTAGAQQLSDDASLESLSVVSGVGQTKMTPAFDPEITDYFVAAPSEGDMVTVNVLPNHDRATLRWIGRDADPNLPGHQVAVTAGTTESVSVRVEAEDGETYGRFYGIRVARASNLERGWRVYDDVLFDDIVDDSRLPNHYLDGLWADEDRVFVSALRHDPFDQKLYAFSAADSSRRPDDEFVLSGRPDSGIWSDGTTLWALDSYGTLRAYNLSDGSEIPEWSADLTPDGFYDTRDVDEPRGIWSDGDTLWVVDKDNAKVVAFALPTKCSNNDNYCRQPLKDFDLAAENDNPWGITAGWSGVGPDRVVDTWWVTNATEDRAGENELDKKLYAYNADGSRNSDLDFDLKQLDISNLQQFYYGLAATETIMYVAEFITGRIYSFSMPGVSGPIGPALVSSDATLGTLRLEDDSSTEIPLNPTLTPGQFIYTANVELDVTSVTVTAIPTNHPNASAEVIVDGQIHDDGVVSLKDGTNTIVVRVTAQDGTTKDHTVRITRRAKSTDATLDMLEFLDMQELPNVTLDPAFSSATETYTASVVNGVESTTVTPTLNDSAASFVIQLDGVTDADGVIDLAVGANVITVVVTAEDDSATKTYKVTVTRAGPPPSQDATLNGLDLTDVTLVPEFLSTTETYTASVGNGVVFTAVTPTLNDSAASFVIQLDGVTDVDGVIDLAVGANVIMVVVTAEDPSTMITYKVTVTRAQKPISTDATLDMLEFLDMQELPNVTLDPAFSATVTEYTALVANGVTATKVTPTLNSDAASFVIQLGGVTDVDGVIDLAVGANVITVVVTAEDTSTMITYKVTVTRAQKPISTDATLDMLVLSGVTLDPAFSAAETEYTALVANGVTATKVTPTLNSDAASYAILLDEVADDEDIDLAVGDNVITVVVTAEDDSTMITYKVTVTREARSKSTDATLDMLVLSGVTLDPAFSAAETEYTALVANGVYSTTVTPTLNHSAANYAVTLDDVDDDNEIDLAVGANVIKVVVTAEDDSTMITYKVTVTRDTKPAETDATLANLVLSDVTLDPTFRRLHETYTASVANGVASTTVTPTLYSSAASYAILLDEVADDEEINLAVGANVIEVVVTAENGTDMKTYTVTVTRAASGSQPPVTTTPGNTNPGNGFVYTGNFNPGTGSSNPGTTTVGDSSGDGSDSDDESDDVTPLEDAGDAGTETEAAINALHRLGVFTGTLCQSNRLCPNDPMQRWIAAVWLVRLIDGDDPAPVTESRFEDVNASSMWEDSVWYAPHVERLADLEVTVGCTQDPLRFCPDVNLTRAQVASWLARAFDLESAEPQGFADAVGSVHEANINAVVAAGVMSGCSTDPKNFCLDDTVTKGEMARYVYAARNVSLGLS